MGGRDRENQSAAQRAGVAPARDDAALGPITLLRHLYGLEPLVPPRSRHAAWLRRLQREGFLRRRLSEFSQRVRREQRPPVARLRVAATTRAERARGAAVPGVTPRQLALQIRRLEGRGRRLDQDQRQRLAPIIGFDPGAVRVYTGPIAAAAVRGLQARAFTIGRDVFFGAGRFAPHTVEGEALIAHELTHVRQQTREVRLQRDFGAESSDPLEREAQRTAARVRNLARARSVQRGAAEPPATAPPPDDPAASAGVENEATQATTSPASTSATPEFDPAVVAERVYRLMVREARTARARGLFE